MPDLGALESAPLSGEGLKDLKPKGILVAHLHEHKGPVVQVKVIEISYIIIDIIYTKIKIIKNKKTVAGTNSML
jgi:hypothetical protein